MNCPNCNNVLNDDAVFCAACGTPIATAPVAAQETYNVAPQPQAAGGIADIVKKVPKKVWMIAIPVVAVLAVIALILIIAVVPNLLGGSDKPQPHGFYLKDDTLMYVNADKAKSFEIADDWDEESGIPYDEITVINDDLIFIPSDMEADEYGYDYTFTLNYGKLKNEAEFKEIDDNVSNYKVSKDGKVVAYTNDSDNLYLFNGKKSEKVDSDVSSFYLSESGKELVYKTSNGDKSTLYYKNGKKDAVEIADDASYLYFIHEDDFSEFYFCESDDDLYFYNGKETEKIASKVMDVVTSKDSKAIYYTSSKGARSGYIGDLIKDESDDDEDSYYESGMYDEDEFNALYFYNGKEPVLISDAVSYIYSAMPDDSDKMILVTKDMAEVSKNSVESYSDIPYSLVVKTTVLPLPEDCDGYALHPNGKSIAYVMTDGEGEDAISTVYTAKIGSNEIKEGKTYVENLNGHADIGYTEDGTLMIAVTKTEEITTTDEYGYEETDYEYEYSYYCNKKLIAENVDYEIDSTDDAMTKLLFTETDNEEDGTEVLYYYEVGDKEIVEVAKDVVRFAMTDDGNVLYLTEYDIEDEEGMLYTFNGKKSVLVDEGVSALLPWNIY